MIPPPGDYHGRFTQECTSLQACGDHGQDYCRILYKVYNTLGYGFLEKVYENALVIELRKQGLEVTAQASITVFYEEQVVGEYFADLFVANAVIVELKAAKDPADEHEAQLLNYLKAMPHEVGLLLNFGP